MARLSNKDDLNVEVFKTEQQFTLANNIVSGHKHYCAKALRKLVSVSCSEEIFSSSRWIMEDLVGSLEDFFNSPILSAPALKALCTYCVKTTLTSVNQLMLLVFWTLSLHHFQKFYVYIMAAHSYLNQLICIQDL